MKYKEIKQCRVCGSGDIAPVLSLGDLHLNAFVASPAEEIAKAPLTLVYCDHCSLVQLRHTADFHALYTNQYWYESHINPVIVRDLQEIAGIAVGMADMRDRDIFLDIGANDGTLLSFVPKQYKRIGVEPAKNLIAALEQSSDVVMNVSWEDIDQLPDGKKARVITAISMFYDSEDPNRFIANVKTHLAHDGLFVAQLMTLAPMLAHNDVSNICHEHLEYYSNGLEIFKVEENAINGGSYRLYARHLQNGSVEYPEHITKDTLAKFARTIIDHKNATVRFIKDEVGKGKNVYGYGASTKGNTILQWYGIGNDLLQGIAEKHPDKIGKMTVGTHIPIVSEEMARARADYFYVLPWGFIDYFLDREKDWQKKGGKFIVSIPEFRVI
jgi:NDP-4-keto-2,6-dideoxyhexose 3-C-methyltransferase